MDDLSDRPPRWTLGLITAFHVGLLLTFHLLYPPFTGFDETQHVDAVLSIRHGDGWPAPQERQLSEGVVAVATPVLRAANELPFSDDEVLPRDDRPSVASQGVERDAVGQALPNQITQHPPLYYAVEAAVLALVPGSSDWPYDRTVAVLRLLSVAMMAPLPLLAWATARALRLPPPAGVSAALLTVAVPQLQRIGASVNNDAAYTLAFAAAVVLLARICTGDQRRRTVLLAGVVVGLALLTKGFALALPPAVALAFLVGRRRTPAVPGRRSAWWLSGLLCLVVAFVVGGWWWLRNLLLYGTVQPSGWPPEVVRQVLRQVPRPPGTPAPITDFVAGSYIRLNERFWGGLEINYVGPDTFPHWLTDTLTVAGALCLAAALVVGTRGSRLPLAAAVLVPFAGTVAIVGIGIWGGYSGTLSFPGAQGRYLFGSLPGLSAGVAAGVVAVAGRSRRALPVLAALLAVGMQAAGLFSVVRRSWLPLYDGRSRADRYGTALDGIVRYSPWPPGVTLTVLAATALAGAVVLVVVLVSTVRRRTAPPAPAPEEPVRLSDRV